MNKVVDFLEKYVQWIALGLGGAFLLLMVYVYVLGTPVPVQVGNADFTPGTVDAHTRDTLAVPLKRQMADGTAPPMGLQQDIATQVRAGFHVPPGEQFAGTAWEAPRLKVGDTGPIEDTTTRPGGPEKIETLPAAPAPVYALAPRTGTAYVQAAPANPANGGANGGANPANPGGNAFPPPAAAGAAGANPAVPGAKDLSWVMVRYDVPMAKLAQTFRQAQIPLPQSQTFFLDAELLREEQQAGGGWGKPESVARLDAADLPVLPAALADNRVENAGRQAAADYLTAAKAAQQPIVQPAFFPVLQGDNPMVEPPVIVPGAAPAFDPATFTGNLSDLPPDQRAEMLKYLRDQAAEKRAQPRTNTPPPQRPTRGANTPYDPRGGGGARGAVGGRSSGGRSNAPVDPEREAQESEGAALQSNAPYDPRTNTGGGAAAGGTVDPYGQRSGGRPGAGRPGVYNPRGGSGTYDPRGGRGTFGGTFGGGAGAGQVLQVPPPPQAPFDPGQSLDVSGWLFDTTAAPNKTYRYQVVYRVRNPLYDTRNIAGNAEVEKTLWMQSPRGDESEGAWTKPVTVQPLTYLFLASTVRSGASGVKFEVYRRYQGEEKAKEFGVDIGDPIGANESGANGPDYRTGFTLVDLRPGPGRENYALLMDANGRMVTRTFDADQKDAKRQQLKQEVEQNTAAASAAGTPPPGQGGSPFTR